MDAGGIMYANGGGGDMMMNGTSPEMSQAQTVLNWNPNQLDIKTKSVEKTLEPLVMQVCNLLYIIFFKKIREIDFTKKTLILKCSIFGRHILKIILRTTSNISRVNFFSLSAKHISK